MHASNLTLDQIPRILRAYRDAMPAARGREVEAYSLQIDQDGGATLLAHFSSTVSHLVRTVRGEDITPELAAMATYATVDDALAAVRGLRPVNWFLGDEDPV